MSERALTIGDLAKATDTKVVTIRYYEQVELLPTPARTRGNYRSYGAEQLDRLRFIRRCRDLGFTLEQVRELLTLVGRGERDCRAIDLIAQEHLAAVERKIADLRRLSAELHRISDGCQGGTVAECRIIEALSPSAPGKSR